MRSLALIIPILISGCYCCPGAYGPGFRAGQYRSCVDSQCIAPPLAGSHHHKRPTLAERRQQRELSRWYRDLNDSPRRGRNSTTCPHCGRRFMRQSQHAFADGFYGDEYYGDGMVFDGFHDGQVIDGGSMNGYCSECESNYGGSYPMYPQGMEYSDGVEYSEGSPNPVPMPANPPMEPTESGRSESSVPELPPLTQNQYYFPPQQNFTTTSQPPSLPPLNEVQPVSVDQSLFVAPRIE